MADGRLNPGEGTEFWLGGDTPLAPLLPGFAPREGQQRMAREVEKALRQSVPLMVEAGTGTGKTLAYLVPAVLSGLKVVVSTGTRTLQDQLSGKELPLLKRGMAPELTWAVLKGRTNYLCRRRFSAFSAQPDLSLAGARGGLEALSAWAETSDDGDLDQVRGHGVPDGVIAEVTANAEQCLGSRCPERERCFLLEARRRAAEAMVVVVNHHLFMADLALKASGQGEALPRYQAVVFDEAHLIEDVATAAFGVGLSQGRLRTLVRDVLREARPAPVKEVTEAGAAGDAFFAGVWRLLGGAASKGLTPEQLAGLAKAGRRLDEALNDLAATLGADEQQEKLAGRAMGLAMDLAAVARPSPGHTVAWAQAQNGQAALNLSPVEVAPHLQHALYQDVTRLVFTSATLAPNGDLAPLRERLGLEHDARGLCVPSPFDAASQSLLYVPGSMPAPSSPGFAGAVERQVERLLAISGGRAFVLFTSRRNLKSVSEALGPRLPYTVLVQGQAPRMELLRRFREQSPAVLFATASFWQGVDVPGPELSAVIVDKLPFSPPDDPLVAARAELLEERGKSGFMHLMLPEAVLSLKQGLGRLLRTSEDRGLLAVLDTRIVTKGYGRAFLKALEPTPLTRELADVERFFAAEPGAAAAGGGKTGP